MGFNSQVTFFPIMPRHVPCSLVCLLRVSCSARATVRYAPPNPHPSPPPCCCSLDISQCFQSMPESFRLFLNQSYVHLFIFSFPRQNSKSEITLVTLDRLRESQTKCLSISRSQTPSISSLLDQTVSSVALASAWRWRLRLLCYCDTSRSHLLLARCPSHSSYFFLCTCTYMIVFVCGRLCGLQQEEISRGQATPGAM
jgi:hypothetical protein